MPELPLVQELIPAPDPRICCERLVGWPYRLWLDSASDAPTLGRFSFLTADPCAVLRAAGNSLDHVTLPAGQRDQTVGDPFEALRELIAPFRTSPVAGIPPFQGGIAGYVGYELGGTLEQLPPPPASGLGVPDLVVGLYDWTLAWDHAERRAWLISTGIPEHGQARRARAEERMSAVLERIQEFRGLPSSAPQEMPSLAPAVAGWSVAAPPVRRGTTPDPRGLPLEDASDPGGLPLELASSLSRLEYLEVVRRVREYILAGDIYQANVSQRFSVPLRESPWRLYIRLRERNPAPFSAFLDFGDSVIASVSPERFLRLGNDGVAEARPIKGTRPRGATPDEDALLAQELLASEKDRSEHLMIVDLMRNDLSRVCAPGTVRVSELFALERYATVHHLVSTVTGRLEAGRDAIDLLRATFPGGSITGAPKIRAMEIIAELEPVRRDVYCGTIGYLSLSGALDASIVIRTILIKDGVAYCSAGGGIVADSEPEAEYAESWDKARGLLEVLGADVARTIGQA